MTNKYPGRFIVFDGLDGSGKSTQANLLISRLRKENYKVAFLDFPQHGERSAALVDDYLNGKYGSALEVGPWRASIFFACDRYDASFKIKKWLGQGKIVVCDRYVGSNIGHQGGKITDYKTRKEYLKWLFDLEYNIFQVPKPDINIILKVDPETALKLCDSKNPGTSQQKLFRRKAYLGDKPKDIHESDLNHLRNGYRSYMEVVKEYPEEFKAVECMEKGQLLSPEEIHEKVWRELEKILD